MTEKHKMRDFINKIFKTLMFRSSASKHWRTALVVLGVMIILTTQTQYARAAETCVTANGTMTCTDNGVITKTCTFTSNWGSVTTQCTGADGKVTKSTDILGAEGGNTTFTTDPATGKTSLSSSGGGIWDIAKSLLGISIGGLIYIIVLTPLSWLLGIAGTFAEWMLQPTYIVNSTVVLVGWGVTRDFANMFFILILLGVALDYILFQSFGVKRALPMLIVVALLINFSLPIAGIFIDFANVFTNFFITKVTGIGCSAGQSCGFTTVIANNLNLTALYNNNNAANLVTDEIFAAFLMLGTAFTLFALGIMFLLRTGWLYALLILLPLVLVLMPFPKTSQYFGRWTNHFFRWIFFAPVAMFFLYLSMLVFQANVNPEAQNAVNPNTSGLSFIVNSAQAEKAWAQSYTGGFIEQVIKYVIVWFFMLGSLTAAQSMSITGAGAAMGMIKGAQKWAGGKVKSAGKKVGGAVAKSAGADTKMDKVAEWASKNKVLSTLGVGRGLRGIASKTEQAIKQQGMLTKDEKERYEKYNDAQLMTEYKDLVANKLPYAQAKAAQVAEMLTRRGVFNVKKADGTVDTEKTQELAIKAYGFAKTHKNKDAMKAIRKSNPIAYQKIVEKEYDDAEKEGKVIRFADPKTGQEFRRHTETGKTLEEAQNRAFDEMTTADFENLKGQWDQNSVEKFFTSGAMTSGHLRAASNSGDHAFLNYVSQSAQSEENLVILRSKSQSFYNYLISDRAGDFGIQVPKNIIEKMKEEKESGYQGEKKEWHEAKRAREEQFDRDLGL